MQDAAKSELRARLVAARAARTADEIALARSAIRAAVLARHEAEQWRCVAGYVPLRTEPGSIELLDELAGRGVRVLVPMLLPDRDLDWARWDAATGGSGPPLGTDAITAAEAVLVPALAVAGNGVRLGRGGGSYDRALARLSPAVAVAALLYDGEVLDELPSDPWDHRVSAAVTPSGWRDLAQL